MSQKSFAQGTNSPAGSGVCVLVLWLLVRHMQSASTLYWSKTRCHADVCHAASTPEMGSLSLDIHGVSWLKGRQSDMFSARAWPGEALHCMSR